MSTAPPPFPPSSPPPPPVGPPPVDPPPWQPPPPGPGTSRPALRRSAGNRLLGGVAGGLAEYSGIDALLWRVGFVALTFAGGTGIVVYLLLWLLMPAGSVDPGTAYGSRPDGARVRAPWSPVPGLTLAALLIAEGSLALLTLFLRLDLGPRAFLGVALLIVGLGLVAGAVTGGRTARGALIALGAFLSLALVVASNEPWRNHDGSAVSERSYRPTTPAEVHSRYESGVGALTLDLSGVDLSAGPTPITTRVEAGVGSVRVLLPASADVQVRVEQGLGHATVFGVGGGRGGIAGGQFFPGTGSAPWTGDGRPEFDLRIEAGIGSVEVSRA